MRPYRLQVERGGHDFDIVQRELASLSHDLSVKGDKRSAIVVKPISVATLLIGIEVDAAELS
jgi:hypothetical protein